MNDVYVGLYERLTSYLNANASQSVTVGDHRPQDDSSYPYVQFNGVDAQNADTATEQGFTGKIDIATYSRYRGLKEVTEITGHIYDALHNYDLDSDIAGTFGVSGIFQDFSQTTTDTDGLTRVGLQRFTIIFEYLGA